VKLFWLLSPIYKYQIKGNSMVPIFRNNDIILINRLAYVFRSPKENDVIVLRDPRNGREILKRIVKVNNSAYFVEGDNKKESTDSREFGPITKTAIIGRVIMNLG